VLSPVVPYCPSFKLSPPGFRPLVLFSDVFCSFPPSPAVLCSYLLSNGRSGLGSWGSSSLLMMAVLRIQVRGRATLCRPVSSVGLGSPPPGPTGPRTPENTVGEDDRQISRKREAPTPWSIHLALQEYLGPDPGFFGPDQCS